jgi:spore photoproduct lyase
MDAFIPQLVYFEPKALEYPLGKQLYEQFKKMNLEIRMTSSHNQIRDLPGENEQQKYRIAKSTLVVGIRKTLKFDSSKPSAEYALPLATGCMGHCHYCYLQTTLGSKPYIRVYVNLDDIFDQMDKYMEERPGEITRFEASCTSDIVGIDHLTHVLKPTIEHIGQSEWGRLRFVTKFPFVDHLLDANHNLKTRFRFSINAPYVIQNFEMKTSSLDERLEGAKKVLKSGYPLGFIVAPILIHENWEEGYKYMFQQAAEKLKGIKPAVPITFELIQHRFTKPAKRVIEQRYPNTKLEMNEEERKYKWGKYGIGKYVYKDEDANNLVEIIKQYIDEYFPEAKIEYFT